MRNEIQSAIQAIYDRDGIVTTSAVLAAAKNKRSPLHGEFEWDDSKAGHKYREIQARTLIRRIGVCGQDGEKPEPLINVPAVSRRESAEGHYQIGSVLVKNKTEFQLALDQALNRLQAAQRAIDQLRDASASADDDSVAKVMLAYEALATANNALQSVH